jgi:ubiquinone/menaquinone biosynthesis C-methylase UbiE
MTFADLKFDRKLFTMLRQSAEATYSSASAASYRCADDEARESESHAGKCTIIRELSSRFQRSITVLDLGCGTGRYFHCVTNVRMLVGVDPSRNMLHHARDPLLGGNPNVRLIRGSLDQLCFAPHSFDLIVCVGVLGLWSPVNDLVVSRMAELLRPAGVLFCSAIEHQPTTVTLKRRLASTIRPVLRGYARRYVETRLRDFTIDEGRLRALGYRYFGAVDISRWQSPTTRVDLHCVLAQPRGFG